MQLNMAEDKISICDLMLERAKVAAEELSEGYFNDLNIRENDAGMRFYFNKNRILADIVFDYIDKAQQALKGEVA